MTIGRLHNVTNKMDMQHRLAVAGEVSGGQHVGGRRYGAGVADSQANRTDSGVVLTAGRKPRARKRAKGAPTHVRSWPLRPSPSQCREIQTRFFTGMRVYNAVLGEFIGRSRMVKADPAFDSARQMPHRTPSERRLDVRRFEQ